jgi:uncharacterized membrane protein
LEKALRLSRRALPFGAGFAVVAVAVLWGLHLWLRFPSWIAWGLSFFATFGPVGDAINIVYCRRKLRHMRE